MRKLQTVTIKRPAAAPDPPAAPPKNPWIALEEIRTEKAALRRRLEELNTLEVPVRIECHKYLGTAPADLLTNRENQVMMELILHPMISNKEIASKLIVSERTVKFHISSLLRKFGVSDRRELYRFAILEGMSNEKIDSAGDLTITRAR